MTRAILIFTYIILNTIALEESALHQTIVWNVGQGQWVTSLTNQCVHFDVGGERSPLSRVIRICQDRLNILEISHLDWDHIRYARDFHRRFIWVCKLQEAFSKAEKKWKRDWVGKISICETTPSGFSLLDQGNSKAGNESSRVSQYKDWLFPGDSPRRNEKRWQNKVSSSIRFFMVSHHGSRSSSSEQLLKKIPRYSTAIVSARKKRYGHPHPMVLTALKKQRFSVLLTEDWGNLRFLHGSKKSSQIVEPDPLLARCNGSCL